MILAAADDLALVFSVCDLGEVDPLGQAISLLLATCLQLESCDLQPALHQGILLGANIILIQPQTFDPHRLSQGTSILP